MPDPIALWGGVCANAGAGSGRHPRSWPSGCWQLQEQPSWLSTGVHAAVPGPQYETEAELGLLRALGATTVSMSLALELRALQRTGMEAAVLSLVVNAGHTSHGGVLAGASDAATTFSAAVAAVLACWGY